MVGGPNEVLPLQKREAVKSLAILQRKRGRDTKGIGIVLT